MEICGIDEAGRGPIAGPMVFAGVILLKDLDGLNDSKKLTPKKREELFQEIIENSIYHIVFKSNEEIDKKGLSKCIQESLIEIKNTIKAKKYLFDGNSNFKVEGIEPIIKGDEKIKEISAASILAKVSRDRFMIEISKKYPKYRFDKHKGYITPEHKKLIAKYGFCEIHRRSYKINITPSLFEDLE